MEIDDDSSEVKKPKDWVSNSGEVHEPEAHPIESGPPAIPDYDESDAFEWGYKSMKMVDDDTIFKLNYQQEGTKKKSSVDILLKDFNRLEPSVYLNDTLVLFFLKFLENYVLEDNVRRSVHIFNSFFMQMIT